MEAYCITLKETPTRAISAQKELSKLPDDIHWQMHIETRDSAGGLRGVYMSHCHVMQKALALGLPYILVFEDDLNVLPWNYEAWYEVRRFVQNHEFDTIRLGWGLSGYPHHSLSCLSAQPIQNFKYLFLSPDCQCLHAVIYSRNMMKNFLFHHAQYIGTPIDVVLSEYYRNSIVVAPMMIGQYRCLGTTVQPDDNWCDLMEKVEPVVGLVVSNQLIFIIPLFLSIIIPVIAMGRHVMHPK
jgi:hypothetical protein